MLPSGHCLARARSGIPAPALFPAEYFDLYPAGRLRVAGS